MCLLQPGIVYVTLIVLILRSQFEEMEHIQWGSRHSHNGWHEENIFFQRYERHLKHDC